MGAGFVNEASGRKGYDGGLVEVEACSIWAFSTAYWRAFRSLMGMHNMLRVVNLRGNAP